MPLNIAYIASRWDYGDPSRGLSFEETNFRSALEGMGHAIHPYDFVTRCKQIGKNRMNAELSHFVRRLEPDLVFFVLFKDEIAVETIRSITAAGIPTFNWFCDDHWRFESFSRHYAPAFSLVSTTHPESVPKYHALDHVHVVLTQWACNQYGYRRATNRLAYEVTFVGQPYGDRRKVVTQLRRAGFDVRCWGYGWQNGRIPQDRMVEVFGASRINLNLSNSWAGPRWRRHAVVGQIKARVFEIAGSGGFVLTERAPNLEAYFELERELSVFRDEDELVEKIRYWLDHERERAAVAEAGHCRVTAEHTYDHRLSAIFSALDLAG